MSEQLDFLTDPGADDIGKFQRPGDAAETQRVAAVQAYPLSGKSRIAVLSVIAGSGNYGATDEEIQSRLDMNPSTQRPRRVELVEQGWIEDSERRRATASRRSAVVWVLTPAGRRQWLLLKSEEAAG